MENIQDSAEAPPKQSYLDRQLSEAVTPPSERAKLNASMDAFFKEIDEGETAPEPVKGAPLEPVAVEAAPEPTKRPVTQIALQPAPRPVDPDPMDQQAKQMEILAHITRHPDYKQERVATQRAMEDIVREMSLYFDAPPEEIKNNFTDPLVTQFTAEQLTDEWFEEQAGLMKKASPIMKRKIEAKWLAMRESQARQNKKAQELAQSYEAEQQQRATQSWQAAIMAEATSQLNDESEFRALKDIRDRANKGDPKASAQFNDLERDVFRPFMVRLMTEHPDTPPGQATRRALRAVKDHLQGKRTPAASSASQPTRSSSASSSSPSHKPLPQNARASLEAAFERWAPPEREDTYWDSKTSSFKPRSR
jgi:hypothetical protein